MTKKETPPDDSQNPTIPKRRQGMGSQTPGQSTQKSATEDSDRSISGAEEPRSVVKQFFRRGEAFIEELLDENEKLRLRVMHLEGELHQNKATVPPAGSVNELQTILEQLKQEHEDLRRRYDEILGETKQHKSRYQQIEEENEKLVNLFVASYQLHSTMNLNEAVQIVTEILLNFVGAGRFALFMREGDQLVPVSSYGVGLDKLKKVEMSAEWIKTCVAPGRPHVSSDTLRSDGFRQDEPLVCLPLTLEGATTGAIFIYAFLQQKGSLSPIDLELFNLLSDHTAVVLEGARLFKEAGEDPAGASRYKKLLDPQDG